MEKEERKRIEELLELISLDEELVSSLESSIKEKKHLNVSGLSESQKGYVISALAYKEKRKPIVICSDSTRARAIEAELSPFIDGDIITLIPSELSLVAAVAESRDNDINRAGILSRIILEDYGALIIVAQALANIQSNPSLFKESIHTLWIGDREDPQSLSEKLTFLGYEHVTKVEKRGEYSLRGDVLDVFCPDKAEAIRISFFDDEIDQIKTFDITNQRSIEGLKKVDITPSTEIIIPNKRREYLARKIVENAAEDINKHKRAGREAQAELLQRHVYEDSEHLAQGLRISGITRYLPIIVEDGSNVLQYIDANEKIFFVDELSECRERMNAYLLDYVERVKSSYDMGILSSIASSSVFDIDDVMINIDRLNNAISICCLKSFASGLPGGFQATCNGIAGDNYRGNTEGLARIIKDNNIRNKRTVFFITGTNRVSRLISEFLDYGVSIDKIALSLPSGFSYPRIGLTIIGETDIFGVEKLTSSKTRAKGKKITFFDEIKPGDYVVHDEHGIGRYEGIVTMRVGKGSQDYLKVVYANNGIYYCPLDKLDFLQRYVGPNGRAPRLSSLDSGAWEKSVEKARSSVKKIAYDLVKLYAARRKYEGFAFEPDGEWQKTFEDNFKFVETEDQLNAISDIKKDMESIKPMDRLLCGDVGFGKTEVAFRAMFKCVASGKQAFMLAPTTLLASQHYENFKVRAHGFPISVKLLSRYVSPQDLKIVLREIEEGKIDVVIGTHRILSEDVKPKDLGLLVVDEEQRFGVNHKEKIKAYKNNIDVLTLTATPIPRTLHMSMAGIRDISVLDEAPMNRRPVQTYVLEYDEEIVVNACMREIGRGGQVFFLHNNTKDIKDVAENLQTLMPMARILYAHGKMSENQMERIVESFILGEADILVCTTIIESGVDMPNVNTIIVEDSDRFGLAQLYQIKGRVGRSDRQAYAYITYEKDKEMNSDAKKRLMAIREFTELGSGIKVAMRDLEVRGAGNLLGAEQHGQMDVIGYELYSRLLDQEIKKLTSSSLSGKDEFTLDERTVGKIKASSTTMEIDFDSYIPSSYISDDEQRMMAYRKIGAILYKSDYDDFMDEIEDRYGEVPPEVQFLCGAALIKSMASSCGFSKVSFKETGVLLYYSENYRINMESIGKLVTHDDYQGRIMLNAQGTPYIHYRQRTMRHNRTVNEVIKLLAILEGS